MVYSSGQRKPAKATANDLCHPDGLPKDTPGFRTMPLSKYQKHISQPFPEIMSIGSYSVPAALPTGRITFSDPWVAETIESVQIDNLLCDYRCEARCLRAGSSTDGCVARRVHGLPDGSPFAGPATPPDKSSQRKSKTNKQTYLAPS